MATPRKNSDHRGILFLEEDVDWGPKPFRIFNIWLKDSHLLSMIKEEMEDTSRESRDDIHGIFKRIKAIVKKWNKEFNGNIFTKIKEEEDKLAREEESRNDELIVTAIKQKLEDLHLIKESMLKQQSRIKWLKDGDKNTKFFHQSLHKRRSKNSITKLQWQGRLITSPQMIKEAAREHFQSLFSSHNDRIVFRNSQLIAKLLSEEDCKHLERPVSKKN
ncbi:hypothetical protein DCAR_0728177 [Daucus carota subsp. sativus]|uniref:Uncharacterized protein n=1 Tax=Daucus carota subsp. sativus TaxID=79200 RepID=A0AAF0XIJ7_DAUCS|nr:PREDICTED: uncharacterized protein LOC108203306 [Daucus carota subsp. sativus]WOH08730.1 hypothetical protein DCAR_0728177 [Daucus carota subsp. sativus]